MIETVQFVLLGGFSGFIAGLLGVGGGLIIVPAVLYLLAANVAEPQLMHTAIATALAVIVPTSISSIWAHHQHGAVDWDQVKKLAPSVLLGALCGGLLTRYLSFDFLRFFFAGFEIVVAGILYFDVRASSHAQNLSSWVWRMTGYVIGLVSAIVGIGGGTMTTPFLVYNNVNIKNAIATSAAIGLPIAIAGSAGFLLSAGAEDIGGALGFVDVQVLLSIAIASVLFAPLGAKVAHAVDSEKLKKGFALLLACLGILVIVF